MKLHPLIAGGLLSVLIALQGWTLKSVHDLDVKVAVLTQRLDDSARHISAYAPLPFFVTNVPCSIGGSNYYPINDRYGVQLIARQ